MTEIPSNLRNNVISFIESCKPDRLKFHLREWAFSHLKDPRDILSNESIGAAKRRTEKRVEAFPISWRERLVLVCLAYEHFKPGVSLTGFDSLKPPKNGKVETSSWREFKAGGVYITNRIRLGDELKDEVQRIESAIEELRNDKEVRKRLGLATSRGRPPKSDNRECEAERTLRRWEEYTDRCTTQKTKASISGFISDCEEFSVELPTYDEDTLRKMIRARKRKENRWKRDYGLN